MTRISSIEQFQQGIDNILRQQARLNQTQLELSTGKKVNKPSDDPSAATQLLKLSALKSNTAQYDRNIDAARNQLELQESVLSNVGNVLQRVRELVIQANNATQSNQSRAAIADELYNRIDELLQYANTKDPDGEYVFSGFNARTPAYVKSGAGYTYQGDQGQRFLQISEDTQIAVRNNGEEIFSGALNGDGRFILETPATNQGNALVKMSSTSSAVSDDYTLRFINPAMAGDPLTYETRDSAGALISSGNYVSGGAVSFRGITLEVTGTPVSGDTYSINRAQKQDMFATVRAIADALASPNDSAADFSKETNDLSQAIASVDETVVHMQSQRTTIGNRLQLLENRSEENAAVSLRLEKQISELQDLDFAQAVSQLNIQSTALEAAQQSYIRIQGLSLFNFLR
jgi:flagellar hook-associated protein 3 FlgL